MRVLHQSLYRSGIFAGHRNGRSLVVQLENAYFMLPVGVIILEIFKRPDTQITVLSNSRQRLIISIENLICL
ncbi:hypothetical protein D3C81_2208430 [compost metagenome]